MRWCPNVVGQFQLRYTSDVHHYIIFGQLIIIILLTMLEGCAWPISMGWFTGSGTHSMGVGSVSYSATFCMQRGYQSDVQAPCRIDTKTKPLATR